MLRQDAICVFVGYGNDMGNAECARGGMRHLPVSAWVLWSLSIGTTTVSY